MLVSADVGKTMRAVVTATNASGSTPATSAQSAVVQAAPTTTFGKTAVGALTHALGGNYLEASGRYTLRLAAVGDQAERAICRVAARRPSMRAVIYADSGSQPGAFVAVSQPVTIAAGQAAGWVDFPVSGLADAARGPVLARLVGVEHERSGLLRQQSRTAAATRPPCFSAAQQPAGELAGRRQLRRRSPTPCTPPWARRRARRRTTTLPAISGTATQGQALSATNGTWSNNPTGFAYQWRRCDAGGASCADIAGATNSTYTLVAADVANDDPGGR